MRPLALALLIPLTSLSAVHTAHAQESQEPTTAGFLLAYAPGDRATFEEGYRRHLDWHRAQGDSLSWFGWDVLVGPRPGAFVDGVFGVPFAALDVRVDPAGDQADAAANVQPYAEATGREMIALRPDLGTATPLEEGAPTPLVQVVRYDVAESGIPPLEAALSALRNEASGASLLPYTVYERVTGAEPGFVLMIWRSRLATFDDHTRNPDRALRRLLGERRPDAVTDGLLRSAVSELWVYRRDLTYLGEAEERQ